MGQSLAKSLGSDNVGLGVLKALADNGFDSKIITESTRAGKIIYANRACNTLTGFSPAEAVGKRPRILRGPSTDKKVLNRLGMDISKKNELEGTAINDRKDGTLFIMAWRVVPVKMGKKIKHWLAIQREASRVKN